MAKPRFQRSDIPYKDRLLMQKYQTIAAHRDDAAKIAMQVACVALNDTEGLGYIRLSRFAKRLKQLLDDYYAEPEVESYHLQKRLEQIGFRVVDGRMYCAENAETGEIVSVEKLTEQDGKI